MMNATRTSIGKVAVAVLLLLTTTVGSASAQCASTCLIYYGRFAIQDGEVYWYRSCTVSVIDGHTYYNCYYSTLY